MTFSTAIQRVGLLGAGATLLLLTACGGGGTESASAPAGGDTTTDAPATETASTGAKAECEAVEAAIGEYSAFSAVLGATTSELTPDSIVSFSKGLIENQVSGLATLKTDGQAVEQAIAAVTVTDAELTTLRDAYVSALQAFIAVVDEASPDYQALVDALGGVEANTVTPEQQAALDAGPDRTKELSTLIEESSTALDDAKFEITSYCITAGL